MTAGNRLLVHRGSSVLWGNVAESALRTHCSRLSCLRPRNLEIKGGAKVMGMVGRTLKWWLRKIGEF